MLFSQVDWLPPQPANQQIKLCLTQINSKSAQYSSNAEHTKTGGHILAVSPELFPETSRDIVLQSGGSEVAEDDLQVAQHSDVVLLAVLSLIERGLVIKLVVITEHFIPGVHITLQHNDRLCLDKRRRSLMSAFVFLCF